VREHTGFPVKQSSARGTTVRGGGHHVSGEIRSNDPYDGHVRSGFRAFGSTPLIDGRPWTRSSVTVHGRPDGASTMRRMHLRWTHHVSGERGGAMRGRERIFGPAHRSVPLDPIVTFALRPDCAAQTVPRTENVLPVDRTSVGIPLNTGGRPIPEVVRYQRSSLDPEASRIVPVMSRTYRTGALLLRDTT
jgi:hypothetical protein